MIFNFSSFSMNKCFYCNYIKAFIKISSKLYSHIDQTNAYPFVHFYISSTQTNILNRLKTIILYRGFVSIKSFTSPIIIIIMKCINDITYVHAFLYQEGT